MIRVEKEKQTADFTTVTNYEDAIVKIVEQLFRERRKLIWSR